MVHINLLGHRGGEGGRGGAAETPKVHQDLISRHVLAGLDSVNISWFIIQDHYHNLPLHVVSDLLLRRTGIKEYDVVFQHSITLIQENFSLSIFLFFDL